MSFEKIKKQGYKVTACLFQHHGWHEKWITADWGWYQLLHPIKSENMPIQEFVLDHILVSKKLENYLCDWRVSETECSKTFSGFYSGWNIRLEHQLCRGRWIDLNDQIGELPLLLLFVLEHLCKNFAGSMWSPNIEIDLCWVLRFKLSRSFILIQQENHDYEKF